jgi:PST family polysaccharide transporter
MGFIIIAKGRQGLLFLSELSWTVVAVSLAWFCVKKYGVNGAGIAFFGSYVFHALLTYPIAQYLTGFQWSVENQRTGIAFFLLIGLVFGAFHVWPILWAGGIGAVAAATSAIYSVRMLVTFISLEQIPRPLRLCLPGWLVVLLNPDSSL